MYNVLLNVLPAGRALEQNARIPHNDCNCFKVTFLDNYLLTVPEEAVHRLHVRMAVVSFLWANGVIFNGQSNGIIQIF
jgi:hypothetical protein